MSVTPKVASKKHVHFAVDERVADERSSDSAMKPSNDQAHDKKSTGAGPKMPKGPGPKKTKAAGPKKTSHDHSRHDSVVSSGTDGKCAPSTSATSVDTPASSNAALTDFEVAKLKSGDRINVFVGPLGNQFIGIEGAYANVFTHFSTLAHKQFVQDGSKTLSLPDVPKHIAKFIYLHMMNEDRSTAPGNVSFGDLCAPDLIAVYRHCSTIGYTALMNKVLPRLRFKIKDWSILLTAQQLADIVEYIPSFEEDAADNVARCMLTPLTMDFGPYYRLVDANPDVRLQLNWAIMDALKLRLPKDGMRTVTAIEAYHRAHGPFGTAAAVKPAPKPVRKRGGKAKEKGKKKVWGAGVVG